MQFNNKKAIYLQIADYYLDRILKGEAKPGERILSVRDLAIKLGVNPNTVMRAYQYLQDKGIIYNKRGIGYFISDNAEKYAREIKYNEFVNNDLPAVFDTMRLLGLSVEDLVRLYKRQKR